MSMARVVAKSIGDVAEVLNFGESFEASYEMPLLAHATMEPLNCTVHVTSNSCDVWVGTQIIARTQSVAAKAAGLEIPDGYSFGLPDALTGA